jgi:HSP20 family protein
MTSTALKPMESEVEETGRTLTARVDVFEKDDEFLVYADMPGVNPQDVDIRYESGELTLQGRRARSNSDKERAGWEYDVTGYQRSFRVGEHIASDKIEADLRQGVLTLRLPKVEAVRPRRIAVRG